MVGGRTAERCLVHATDGMVSFHSNNMTCKQQGCTKQPSYGEVGKGARFCAPHRKPGMVDVVNKNKWCRHQDCTKRASFATSDDDKGRFCAQHALPDMIDVTNKNKRCRLAGCMTRASYGLAGDKKPTFCAVHATVGMTRTYLRKTKLKICRAQGCTNETLYGENGLKHSEFCATHANEKVAFGLKEKRSRGAQLSPDIKQELTTASTAEIDDGEGKEDSRGAEQLSADRAFMGLAKRRRSHQSEPRADPTSSDLQQQQ
ncbi:unnamed protein product [Ectocarpus fasciculatus]